jgi:hypothetical protein
MAIRRIPVPSTPRSSYDPSRPISGLLWAQIAMLEEAVLAHDRRPGCALHSQPARAAA